MFERGDMTQDELLKELFEWDRKFFRIYTDFRPNLKASRITPKFYDRHGGSESTSIDPDTLKVILDHQIKGPRERLSYPETVNQSYGWYQKLLIPMDKTDRRLNNHRCGTKDIRLVAEIKQHLVKEPPFTGVPFKL